MGYTIAEKIIKAHLVSGEMKVGEEIGLRIDQTLTQDATGTMAYLEFEAMGIPQVKTERSVAYVDHNTLQSGFENADDHKYIQTVAAKHGVYFSRPGNGICHQVHYERFGIPGKTLIGSDSHTPTGGGLGMLAMGAGGMDVAVAMGGGAYHIPMPRMIFVELIGELRPNVSAKDKATGKEQSIRIEASSNLSKEEIDRMKAEAEANAAADKAEAERIEKINKADSMIFQTENLLKENGDKLPADVKGEIESALNTLKEAHKSQDVAAIDAATETLNKAMEKFYAQAQTAQPGAQDFAQGAQQSAQGGTQQNGKEDIQDADFEEVK